MTLATTPLLYANPPASLVATAGMVQYSPLIPGSLALEEIAQESLENAVIYTPPGTIERRYVIARVLQALRPDAPFTILAPNDKGGTRLAKELAAFGCEVIAESKQHHRICTGIRPATLDTIDEAISTGGIQLHAAHGMWTQPGIFSWDRIDAGTALLLQYLPALKGNGADLGCGMGALSQAVLGSVAVTSLLMIDIDRRALACARKNIADTRAAFMWADMRQQSVLAPRSLDFVVMNPPFHSSGEEDRSLGQRFIASAADALKAGGQCWITANLHLPYEQLLADRFARVELIATADGYKIFKAEK